MRPLRVVDVRDYLSRDPQGRVQWHYVLLSVLCDYVSGEPFPATDAENARFIPLASLADYEVTATARGVLERVAAARTP